MARSYHQMALCPNTNYLAEIGPLHSIGHLQDLVSRVIETAGQKKWERERYWAGSLVEYVPLKRLMTDKLPGSKHDSRTLDIGRVRRIFVV
jgi:hypothetical protein